MSATKEQAVMTASKIEWPSLNKQVAPLVEGLIRDARALRVEVTRGPLGECLIDCGVRAIGGLEAGRLMSEICLGGLGRVSLEATDPEKAWPFMVSAEMIWPDWAADQPGCGDWIDKNRPICTVLARAETGVTARRLVEDRIGMILADCGGNQGGTQ